MKLKKSLLAIGTSLLMLKMLPLISAAWSFYDVSRGPQDLINIISNFLSPFFEAILNTSAVDDFFFAKVLLLLLLFIVIYYALKKSDILGLGKQRGVLIIISLVVSTLGMRYIPENDFISGILLPYGALAIAITTFLPFLIYFFFVHKSEFAHFGRRAAWAVYAVVFLVLWYNRAPDISSASNWIYLISIVLVILSFIFDSSIHQYFGLGDYRKFDRESKFWNKIEIKEKMEKLMKAMTAGSIKEDEYDHEMKILEERYKQLTK